MRACPGDAGRALSDTPVQSKPHLACIDTQSIEIEWRRTAHRDASPNAYRRTGKIGESRIGHRRNPCIDIRREAPGRSRCQDEIDHGRTACGAYVIKREPARLYGAAHLIAPTGQIAAQGQIGRGPPKGNLHIIG